jgi:predicted RNA binding protein YcfA (HicA-like mRNA interferase family)
MGKKKKLFTKALSSPKNFTFKELCKLAEQYGFELRDQRGSHKIYKHPTLKKMMNFQPDKHDSSKAKNYQIKQLTDFIDEYNLIGEQDV